MLEETLDAFRRYVPRSEVDDLWVQSKADAEAEVREETGEEGAAAVIFKPQLSRHG